MRVSSSEIVSWSDIGEDVLNLSDDLVQMLAKGATKKYLLGWLSIN